MNLWMNTKFIREVPEFEKKIYLRKYNRGVICLGEYYYWIGNPEAEKVEHWQDLINASYTRQITPEELKLIYYLDDDNKWLQLLKEDVENGAELYYWDTIGGFTGASGIVLVQGEKVLDFQMLGVS